MADEDWSVSGNHRYNIERQMIKAVLSLGSNCGFRQKNIEDAIKWISSICDLVCSSSFYFSPDIKGTGNPYLNAVIEVAFDGEVEDLNIRLKDYELKAGRDEHCRANSLVPIDIDIVMADSKIIRQKDFNSSYFKKGFQELKSLSGNEIMIPS